MLFDTHAHYDDAAFDADRDALLEALPASGVGLVIDPGCDVKSSEHALQLAARWPHVYAAVGIHPEELGGMAEGDPERIEALCTQDKCVAVGEIGLDYYWDASRKEEQKALFIEQLKLALRRDLPLKRGWYLGFDGPITYKNARKALEVLEICPLDRVLIETDSPYLSPVPQRGKRNDSRNLSFIVEKIAEIKGCTDQEVEAAALENGRRLFKI